MRFREADQMLKGDGWYVSDISGSHYQYKHLTKPGQVRPKGNALKAHRYLTRAQSPNVSLLSFGSLRTRE